MKTARVTYQGQLRTKAEHIRSGQVIHTDAPVDNQGKGEAFSPTDLVATATLTCMITMMGITARKNDIEMGKVEGEVEKVMTEAPRRISALHLTLHFSGHNLSDTDKALLENAALNCPVTRSLHPEIMINVKFAYV
ncbi:MAG: OsmC family peroxiredoxin [Bacteroidetes bacterium]|nr:MAG: OsmC family peroxiredoxin [Bacteroidota bacterium]